MSRDFPTTVPSDDRGLLLGDGLFETVRLYGGRPFRLDRHLRRLEEGAARVGIPVPRELGSRVDEAVASAGRRDAVLRITLTRGSGPGLHPPDHDEGRLVLGIRNIPVGPPAGAAGLAAVLRGRLDERALTSGLKVTGYMERIQALRLAREAGADEALLVNSTGRIVEGSSSNLLAILDGGVLAPGAREGALEGITREAILEPLRASGVGVEERGVHPEEVAVLSEVLLTSSIREIAPVVRIEGSPVGDGRPGPWFRRLAEAFQRRVREEVRG